VAAHKRMEVLNRMKQVGLVPVFYHPDAETAIEIARSCIEAGADCIEFTNRGDRAIDVFRALAEYRDASLPQMVLGVGSICDAPTAALYIAAGADFVVGPAIDEETAQLCNLRKIAYSPGCATLGEIQRAHALGVEICKIFPAGQLGGPAFVKAVRAPCPWAELMPTGGVEPTRDNLEAWFRAGVCCVGMGSKLITGALVSARDWSGIRDGVASAVAMIESLRSR
jgi:2-dehydro-3-deoxyphosphogluconate aldolase / (4S)-4-hydroxy-2-oxoglutarate aldolase